VDRVHIWDCALDGSTADNLKRICDGLHGNRRLRHLNIHLQHDGAAAMERDTVARAVDGTSSLTELEIGGAHWTDAAIRALWLRLRTNDRLEHFHVASVDRRHRGTFADRMLDTLSRYNWTLRFVSVDGFVSSRVQELLTDNATIRILVDALEDRGYRIADVTVWPRIMGRLSSKPTPLYRFLRRGGNVDAWSGPVVARPGPRPRGRRSHPTGDVTNRWDSDRRARGGHFGQGSALRL
jgi:hypothetical protein